MSRLGATPVFVDIERETFNLDAGATESAVTARTKAIIPVHLFGQCVDMDAFKQLKAKYNVAIVEDAAQAIGAGFKDGVAGGMGDTGCFSFYPTKNLGGFGDGGMITTNSDDLAEKLRKLRNHGMHPRYYHEMVGVNSRLDSMQAATLMVKFPHLEEWTEMRRANAQRYSELFTEAKLDGAVQLPVEAADRRHVWNQYTIRVAEGRRDAVRQHLSEANIGSEIYYPVPLHQQSCFQGVGCNAGELTETDRAAAEVISLPIFPELTAVEQQRVVSRVADFYANHARHAA